MLISGFRHPHFLAFVQGLKNRHGALRKRACASASPLDRATCIQCSCLPWRPSYRRARCATGTLFGTYTFFASVQCPKTGNQRLRNSEFHVHCQSIIYGLRLACLSSCKPVRCLTRCSSGQIFWQISEISRARNSALDEKKRAKFTRDET